MKMCRVARLVGTRCCRMQEAPVSTLAVTNSVNWAGDYPTWAGNIFVWG